MENIKVEVVLVADVAKSAAAGSDTALATMAMVGHYVEFVGAKRPCLVCGCRILDLPRKFAIVSLGEQTDQCRAICDRCAELAPAVITAAATNAFSSEIPTAGTA